MKISEIIEKSPKEITGADILNGVILMSDSPMEVHYRSNGEDCVEYGVVLVKCAPGLLYELHLYDGEVSVAEKIFSIQPLTFAS